MAAKKFEENCKKIAASTELTVGQKEILIEHEAAMFTDRTFDDSMSYRHWQKRLEAAERRLAGHNGFSYCPHDGEWSPERPPEIQTLDQEYVDMKKRATQRAEFEARMKFGDLYAPVGQQIEVRL